MENGDFICSQAHTVGCFLMLENKNITQSTEKQVIQNFWKTLFIRQPQNL